MDVDDMTREELVRFLERRGFTVRPYDKAESLRITAQKHVAQNPDEDPERPIGGWG